MIDRHNVRDEKEQYIIDCANALLQAVKDAGLSALCSDTHVQVSVNMFAYTPDKIDVDCIIQNWWIYGKRTTTMPFNKEEKENAEG